MFHLRFFSIIGLVGNSDLCLGYLVESIYVVICFDGMGKLREDGKWIFFFVIGQLFLYFPLLKFNDEKHTIKSIFNKNVSFLCILQ